MANDLGDSRQWRDTVETRLGTLEARVEEEGRLRAAMDEDMSDLKTGFRSQRRLLQSLHHTQQEHTTKFEKLDERLGKLDERVGKLEERVGELSQKMQAGFERIHAGVDALLGLLGGKPGHE